VIFNSFEFIFVFLPTVFLVYFLLNRWHFTVSKIWLLLSSLFFYSWWNPKYLPLILVSLFVNFFIGTYLGKEKPIWQRKFMLTIGIVFNVNLLGFFKYYDFLINNINLVFSTDFNLLYLVLPLAISFYTFQQIGYLVDSYRQETKGYVFLDYALFVSFFPQLIAGPIVHHKDVMDQFRDPFNRRVNAKHIAVGLLVFSIGLFKKVVIADAFAVWVNNGYSMAASLTFIDAWMTSLSYTFQLYFDFSGYSDMAIGAGLLFNIHLPKNFNSPYKALNIQDFWRRWHITLSTFLTRYIYIPLGGNRKGAFRTYVNILIIFAISGIWHGAGWTFVVWGLLHGIASVINRFWTRAGFSMNKVLAWFITFQFVNATWVFFRAPNFTTAIQVLKGMAGLNGVSIPDQLANMLHWETARLYAFSLAASALEVLLYLACALFIVLVFKNSYEWKEQFKPKWYYAVFAGALFIYSAFHLQKVTEFLYFNF
jgi:alginate O-acetyltransferase complex protein AlgI